MRFHLSSLRSQFFGLLKILLLSDSVDSSPRRGQDGRVGCELSTEARLSRGPCGQGWISGMISRLVHRDRGILHGLSVRYPAPSVIRVALDKNPLLSFGGFQRRIGTEPVPPSIRAGQCQPPETACALSALSYPLKGTPSTKTVVAIGHLDGPRVPLPNSQCLFQASSL